MALALRTLVAKPTLAPATRRPNVAAKRAPVAPAAALPHVAEIHNVVATLAEAAKPGDVDAPFGAIAFGAVIVTAAALLVAQGLQSGGDAADKIFERDARSGRRR